MKMKVDEMSRRSFLEGALLSGIGAAATLAGPYVAMAAEGAASGSASASSSASGSVSATSAASEASTASAGSSTASASTDAGSDKIIVGFDGVANPTKMTGDGRYVTKVMGHEDWIFVATEFADGAITNCSVMSDKETIGIGSFACSRIPAAIVANQSVCVPNVRGCSITSMAIKSAVTEAINLSGYNIDDFSAEVPEPDVDTEETRDVDAVVIGAGNSGLVCAGKLVDLGYNVLVLEKHAIPGGSWGMTYSGFMAAETKAIKSYNTDGSVPANFATMDGMFQALQEASDPDQDRYDGQAPFAHESYPAMTRAIDWMQDISVGFMPLGFYEGTAGTGFMTYFAPGMYMGGAGFACMTVEQRIGRSTNGEILYMTKATELIQDEATGAITGVKAVGLKSDDSENGYKLTVNAKAVVLATGSYAHNVDLLKEYEPTYADQLFNCCSASTGDGTVMALNAGSKMECTGLQFPAYPATTSYFEVAFISVHKPCLTVNNTGGWIGQTDSSHAALSRALLDPNNGGRFFYVFDESSVATLRYHPMMGYDTYKALFDRGEVWYYPTVEAAMDDLDLPELADYIAENNKAALAGEADKYGQQCTYLEAGTGIYLTPAMPVHYLTPSGICIDPQQRVLTDSYVIDGENTVIPGLYAVGDVPGTISTREGRGYYNGHPLAVASGYLAAETIASDFGA